MRPKCNPSVDAELGLTVVGAATPESDAAIARFLERFLEREQPGTSWVIDTAGTDVSRAA
jgi:hypothetical protein